MYNNFGYTTFSPFIFPFQFLFLFYLSLSLLSLSITSRHTYDQICANVYYPSFFLSFSLIVCLSLSLYLSIYCYILPCLYQIDVRDILRGIEVKNFSSSLSSSFHSLSLSLLYLPPSLYLSYYLSLSPSLSLLSIILFCVSNGRFLPCLL